MTTNAAQPQPTLPAIGSPAEAQDLAAHFIQVMDDLVDVVEEETRLVRSGKARAAAALAQRKSELSQRYLTDATRVRAGRGYLRRHLPELLSNLQERHERFRALLQINLTVLATAHAVAEGLVRGVSGGLARKSSPQTYTSNGRNAAPPNTVPPMAVSRQL
jgi:hypothetical protein